MSRNNRTDAAGWAMAGLEVAAEQGAPKAGVPEPEMPAAERPPAQPAADVVADADAPGTEAPGTEAPGTPALVSRETSPTTGTPAAAVVSRETTSPDERSDLAAVQDAIRQAVATQAPTRPAPAPHLVPPAVPAAPRPAETATDAGTTTPVRPTPSPDASMELSMDTPIGRAAETAVQIRSGDAGAPLPRPERTRIFTIANQKGGVGKTTSTVNVAAALALHGLRVLVIDLDPQGNASTALGVPHHAGTPSVYEVLVEGRPLVEVVQPAEGIANLFCAPATIDLAGAEIELVSLVARETRLQRAITAYNESLDQPLDYVLIDCPPSLGLLTVNAFVAAEEVLIPIQCEYYALEGLGQLLRNVDMIKAHLNPRLRVSTILLTMYDGRTRLAAQVADEVREHFGDVVLRTAIPRSVRVSEAPSYQQTVITYDPGSSGAICYLEAAREIALAVLSPPKSAPTSAAPAQEGS
jgi:chromosome partitioning protein